MFNLITDILDFSKIEANELKFSESNLNVKPLVETSIQFCVSANSRNKTPVVADFDSSMSGWILGDEARIRQVLVNLIGNALKFTPDGEITVNVKAESGDLLFSVSDTGIGIPETDFEKIFDPFLQVDSSFSRQYEGTGLGLSIARKFSRLMSGDIRVNSVVDVGTQFVFALPLRAVTPQGTKPDDHAKIDSNRNLRFLIVEDNLTNQFLILKILDQIGFNADIDVAVNDLEAVNLVNKSPYDWILMDLQIPVMDGYEAMNKIRSNSAITQPRIIVISGNVQPEDVSNSYSAGADGFLPKPIDREALINMINTVS